MNKVKGQTKVKVVSKKQRKGKWLSCMTLSLQVVAYLLLAVPPPLNAQDWSLTGNSGTNPNSNFLGTIDKQPLIFKANGVERLRVDEDGNVGIGTKAPQHGKLEVVEGHISILGTSDTFDQSLNIENDVAKLLKLTVGANRGGTAWYTQANTGTLGVDRGMDLRFSAGAAEVMRITSTGNVGIGVNNPKLALDVQGRTRLRDGIGGPAAGTAGLWFNTVNQFAPGGIADIGFIGAVDPTRIGLYGNDPRGGSLWGFTFDTVTGNVGIGTQTDYPTDKLQVNGDILAHGVRFPDGSFQTTAALRGPQGPQGVQGPTGPQGPPGPVTRAGCSCSWGTPQEPFGCTGPGGSGRATGGIAECVSAAKQANLNACNIQCP